MKINKSFINEAKIKLPLFATHLVTEAQKKYAEPVLRNISELKKPGINDYWFTPLKSPELTYKSDWILTLQNSPFNSRKFRRDFIDSTYHRIRITNIPDNKSVAGAKHLTLLPYKAYATDPSIMFDRPLCEHRVIFKASQVQLPFPLFYKFDSLKHFYTLNATKTYEALLYSLREFIQIHIRAAHITIHIAVPSPVLFLYLAVPHALYGIKMEDTVETLTREFSVDNTAFDLNLIPPYVELAYKASDLLITAFNGLLFDSFCNNLLKVYKSTEA